MRNHLKGCGDNLYIEKWRPPEITKGGILFKGVMLRVDGMDIEKRGTSYSSKKYTSFALKGGAVKN